MGLFLFTRIAKQPNVRTVQLVLMCPKAAKQVLVFLAYFTVTITTFHWCLFCATGACFKLKHGGFSCNSQLRLQCDRCDFSSNQRSINPTSLSGEDEGCGLGEECGPCPKYKPLWSKLKAPTVTETQTGYSPFIFHTDWVCISLKRETLKTLKILFKLPTFSAQRARHSEQHGPDKQQTSRRLHLL